MSEKEAPLNAVRGLVEAINEGHNSAGLSVLTDDVVIIDDIPPFRWSGHEGAELWLRRLAMTRKRLNASVTLEDADVRVAQERAYVIAPGQLEGSSAQGRFQLGGLLSSTLVERDGKWLVDSLVWSNPR